MYSKHHENRRQSAMKLFGMHKNYGGVLDASDGDRRVRRNMGGSIDGQNIGTANELLRNAAENMVGAKRGGFIHKHRHHAVKKAHGGNVGMEGLSKHRFESKEGCRFRKGGKAHEHKHMNHEKHEGKRHERREHMMAEKHGHREKFAMGGVGKIRLKQMTLSGKPIPCHKGKKKHDAREVY